MPEDRRAIGRLVDGGIKSNLICQVDDMPIDDISIGSPVTIPGRRSYLAIVVDSAYDPAKDPRFSRQPLDDRLPVGLAERISKRANQSILELMLNLSFEPGQSNPPVPAMTLPPFHSPVYLANEVDLNRVFGDPQAPENWAIGCTREGGIPIAINLAKLVRRSSGIFGASGVGKTYLTRVLLSGLIVRDQASLLILDPHNDYGFDDTASDSGALIPGFKTIFPTKVQTYALGRGTKIRGNLPDHTLEIGFSDVLTEDVNLLQGILNLTDTTATTESALVRSFGRNWLREFLKMKRTDDKDEEGSVSKSPPLGSVAAWAKRAGVHRGAAEALHSKLSRLARRPYMVDQPAENGIQLMIASLKRGEHVVLSFGEYQSDLDYLLVANVITRHIREVWVQEADEYRSTQQNEPRHLVIVTEEAHKFLSKEMAGQTAFGGIARELRKSYVVLCLIDQRPSQIDEEVMSQIVTRICGWLGDEHDLNAVLSGLPGKDALRRILSSLNQNGELLLAGWATPTPLGIRSRWFDAKFVQEVQTLMANQAGGR